jgi:hypothetical protein
MMAELFGPTLRFLLVAELFAQLCEFFYSGLSSVNFIPDLSNLCPHQRAWVTPVNCLLSFVVFAGG